ncbi:uncharacterized protein LOC129746759 [Uranotaenia lowii]|uniref:uncharacterized protein LOC129746759 n=1 Tax=Uranotaenia lowii TaxID=190385 RepID=UPI002479E823|nr:uncharacterized protein LOC129746759 [Uranotaenia lowii]
MLPNEKKHITKGWEKLEDDVIIKDVATKGKHVNLCISYLSERNDLSIAEAKNYFLQKVNAYVYRLLSNRQLYKAEHILGNIERNSKYVFYQIAAETDDQNLRDYIRDHLAKTVPNYNDDGEEGEERLLAASWKVYCLLKGNVRQLTELLQEIDPGYSVLEIETMSFNTFHGKNEAYRNAVALDMFFKNQETEISPLLDKYAVWNYLLRNNIDNLVKIWIQINACLRMSPEVVRNSSNYSVELARIKIDIYDDPRFNERLRQLFRRWEINDFMISQLSSHKSMTRNEVLLNALATYGKFVDHERTDPVVILRRLFTTQTLDLNRDWLSKKEFKEALTRHLVENKLFHLMDLSVVSRECLETLGNDPKCQHRKEVQLYLAIDGLNGESISTNQLLEVSSLTSNYLSKYSDNFYEENPLVYFFEYFLKAENQKFPENDALYTKLPHLRQFLNRLKFNPVSSVSSKELLALHDLPHPHSIRDQLFELPGEAEDDEIKSRKQAILKEHGTVPHFNHPLLCEKYANPVKLSFTDYIKQYRSCYAVYMFFLEQLEDYARITPAQMAAAAKAAAEIALQNYSDLKMVIHCVAFIEMLGIDSVQTRAFVRCLNMLEGDEERPVKITIQELVDRCESCVIAKDWADPSLIPDLEAITIVCRAGDLRFPTRYLKPLLKDNNWFRVLLLLEYLNYPMDQILDLCKYGFQDQNVGNNLLRAIKYRPNAVERKVSQGTISLKSKRSSFPPTRRRRKGSATSVNADSHSSISTSDNDTTPPPVVAGSGHQPGAGETPSESSSIAEDSTSVGEYDGARFLCEQYDRDLFATILLCSKQARNCEEDVELLSFEGLKKLLIGSKSPVTEKCSTFLNLLDRSIRRKWPLLAVMAGITSEANRKYCWLVWLLVSVEYPFLDKIAVLQEVELMKDLTEYCLIQGYSFVLQDSLDIFYPESNFINLVKYVTETTLIKFSEQTTDKLRLFLQNASDCPLLGLPKAEILKHAAKLLTLHLDYSFESHYDQQRLLKSLVSSDIIYFTQQTNFTLLYEIANILKNTHVRVKFIYFYDQSPNLQPIFESICDQLVSAKLYKQAIELTKLTNLPKESIIFEHWTDSFEKMGSCNFSEHLEDMERHDLKPDLLINFYIHIANRLVYGDVKKYYLLKESLELIKSHALYPSETFDRDRIEYEMALAYIHCFDDSASLTLYHSQYFSKALSRDRGVLLHTFLELKEVAAIDDLTVSNQQLSDSDEILRLEELINRLLEAGDIVQALRYQAIFEQRPVDLHFIVFCMGLAESLCSLYNLSKEERLMLNEDYKRTANRFERRTLRSRGFSQCSANTSTSSPMRSNMNESMDLTGTSEFEEFPPREKQEIFEAINGLAGKIKYGQQIARRIVLTYRIAMYLDREYTEILKVRDPVGFLSEVSQLDCIHKLEVVSDIIAAHRLSDTTVSDFLASEIVAAVVHSKFYLLLQGSPMAGSKGIQEVLWGYNIDREFHLFLELAPNTTLLGNKLLRFCDAIKQYKKLEKSPERQSISEGFNDQIDQDLVDKLKIIFKNQVLSLKKQNTIIVALLVKAHDCFVHECSVEGIVQILQRCKALNTVLTNAKSWSLVVKMLVGIGRYREMYYCFQTLIKNAQFESLLGQFDERHTNGLKTAIISYLHEHCPDQKEYFKLAAHHFRMYKEIAETWETEAKATIAQVLAAYEKTSTPLNGGVGASPKVSASRLQCAPNVTSTLNSAMEFYMHAVENYLLDNKMSLAQRAASNAELVALQIFFVNQAIGEKPTTGDESITCISVLNIKKDEKGSNLAYYVNSALSVPQALIVARTYDYEINWITALYQHYIINGEANYLEDFLDRMTLTDGMIENLVKIFQQEPTVTPDMERSIATLVDRVRLVTLKYRLASLLGLKRTLHELINGNSFYYLKDCDYGRNEHAAGGN